ncbi:MAG: Bax inhibitor-1/YccA family protein [Nitrospinae bacterium]|nr:Bax inhibitor-1/YccA family protein [Nitrospinota bacterium]
MLREREASTAYAMNSSAVAGEQQRFMVRVYNWMATGLTLTAIVAMVVASSESMVNMIFNNSFVFFALIIAELGLVFYLAGFIQRMSAQKAMAVFLGYAALNGVTFSFVFVFYTASSIASTFFVTALTFGAMSIYGYTTKKDLTSWGSFLFMGLIGIIIASIVNIFLASSMLHWFISCAGVLIFVGLTAYDTQRIKEMNIIGNEGTEEDTKEAISGALTLYLDFINLFLMLLRFLGESRE